MGRTMANLELIVKRARNLPVLPEAISKLLQVVADVKSQAKDVSKIIERDPSLATRFMRQVNSPFYGFSGRVSTIQHAVVIMGFDAVKNLAMGISIAKMSRKGSDPVLDEKSFWEHSVGVGIVARYIAKEIGYPSPEEMLLAGLMHDIGKLILADNIPREYKRVIKEAKEKEEEIYKSEKKILGASHAELGEWFTKEHRFPPVLSACVGYHHEPNSQSSGKFIKAVRVIYLADQLCKLQGIGWAGDSVCSGEIESVYEKIGLTSQTRKNVIDRLKTEIDVTKELFEINSEYSTSDTILNVLENCHDENDT